MVTHIESAPHAPFNMNTTTEPTTSELEALLHEEPWLKTPQACKHLGISVPTLRRWVKAEKLKPKRTPSGEFRFRRSDLNAVLA